MRSAGAPFAFTSGPRDAPLVLLGEAWGESEENWKVPFAGQSGRELFRMLGDAGWPDARELAAIRGDAAWLAARERWLHEHGVLLTNVFALRPDSRNNLGALCASKGELPNGYNLPPLRTENPRFLRPEYLPELRRLDCELRASSRSLVLCLGATALWGLTGSAAIGSQRGTINSGRVLETLRTAGAAQNGRGHPANALVPATPCAGGRDPAAGPGNPSAAERARLKANGRLAVGGAGREGNAVVLGCTGGLPDLRALPDARPVSLCEQEHEAHGEGNLRTALSRTQAPGEAEAYAISVPSAPASFKLLPTYHPAAIFRSWHWRPVVLADLLKARRELAAGPAILRPKRRVEVSPSIGLVEAWTWAALKGDSCSPPAALLAPDIETLHGQIRCIGFARSTRDVLVIPFIAGLKGGSYWSEEEELRAWKCVQRLLESPIPKVGQNFLFDLQYLSKLPFRPRNVRHDTMLLHHTLFPELQKGLGFLGSVYTNETAWKLMRRHKGEEELKKDE